MIIRGKKVCGIGVNDADYNVTERCSVNTKKIIWSCPYWEKWRGMIKRCYLTSYHVKHPTYKGCEVCSDWLNSFMTFRTWMIKQDWEGKQLDKDILYLGNRIYSPDTCIFVSPVVNSFVSDGTARRGKHPIGVYEQKHSPNFMCKINIGLGRGKQKYVGCFNSIESCHRSWQEEKVKRGLEMLNEVNSEVDKMALTLVIDRILEDISNNRITQQT